MIRSFTKNAFGPMRSLCLFRRSLLLFVPLVGSAIGCAGPQWYLDPGFAERLARQENKPLLFYFKAWDSTQHRNISTTVFQDAAVSRELLDTVNVELEFAWSAPYDARYKVHRSQVCVMCKPDGKMVEPALYVNPVPTPEQFLDWLKQAKTLAVPPRAPATTAPSSAATKPPSPAQQTKPAGKPDAQPKVTPKPKPPASGRPSA